MRSLRDDIFLDAGPPRNKTAKLLVSIARTRPRVARVCFSFQACATADGAYQDVYQGENTWLEEKTKFW